MKLKQLLLCLFLQLLWFSPDAAAQTIKQGAIWHYGTLDGVYIFRASKDTIIAGTSCVKITSETRIDLSKPRPGIRYELPDVYLQDAGDTVFAWNQFFGKFTPLYIFNVSDGDTLTLQGFPPHPCETFAWGIPDSNFRYVIDSVRMVRWDTSLLKTVYGRSLRYPARDTLAMDWSTTWTGEDRPSIYVQHMGAVYAGLLPNCQNCAAITDAGCRWIDSLRCYSDRDRAIKLVADACDKGLPPATGFSEDKQSLSQLSIFPNPAGDDISIVISDREIADRLIIFNVIGQNVYQQQGPLPERTHIGNLPCGAYFVRLFNKQQQPIATGTFYKKD